MYIHVYFSAGASCPVLPYYYNSSASVFSTYEGAVVNVTCGPGHRYYDGFKAKSLTCHNHQWTSLPKCLCRFISLIQPSTYNPIR